MGQKGHIMVQKGLKMHEKRQKIEFLDLKNLLFSGIFFNGQSLCSKKLSGKGGYPPLNGQNPLCSFWRLPFRSVKLVYYYIGFNLFIIAEAPIVQKNICLMLADGGSAPILEMLYDPSTNKNQAMNKTSFEGLQPGGRRGWGREGGPPEDRWAADEVAGESQVPAPLQNPWPGPAHWGAI